MRQGGFHRHPLAAIALTDHGLGNSYGMWTHDAQTRQALSAAPNDDQAWSRPEAEIRHGRLAIHATPQDRRQSRVARWADL